MNDVDDRKAQGQDAIDEVLRETLGDDLPAEVEARLEQRVERFLASARAARPGAGSWIFWPALAPGQRGLAVAASVLLACGVGLQAGSGADGGVASLSDVSAGMTLARAVRGATSVRCTGLEDAGLASPVALADRIYRRWVPIGTHTRPDGTVIREFRARDEPARYELVSDDVWQPPREIRRSPIAGAAADGDTRRAGVATCTWEVPRAGPPGIVLMLGG